MHFAKVSTANGGAHVLDALTRLTDAGQLPYPRRDLVTYWVRRGPDEDVEAYRAAHERLREASFRAGDAPPGARGALPRTK